VLNPLCSDFWSSFGQWFATPYGIFGINGSYETTLNWNGSRSVFRPSAIFLSRRGGGSHYKPGLAN
jgi:hypothetical protein